MLLKTKITYRRFSIRDAVGSVTDEEHGTWYAFNERTISQGNLRTSVYYASICVIDVLFCIHVPKRGTGRTYRKFSSLNQ